MSTPRYFDEPFAELGDRSTVPDTPPVGNTVNYQTGWTPQYSSSTNPPRESFNQLGYDLTLLAKQIQETGIVPWNTLIDYGIGAVTVGTDALVYQAIVASQGIDPVTDTTRATWAFLTELPTALGSGFFGTGSTANNKIFVLSGDSSALPRGVWSGGTLIFAKGGGGTNTGAATLSIADNSLMQLVPIVTQSGVPTTGGELSSDLVYGLTYIVAENEFLLIAPLATLDNYGVVQLSNSITTASDTLAATASAVRLAALTNNTTFNGGASGYYRDDDSGFTVQWVTSGTLNFYPTVNNVQLSWPLTWSTAWSTQCVTHTAEPDSNSNAAVCGIQGVSQSQVIAWYTTNGIGVGVGISGTIQIVGFGLS